jgi:tetratricopeptide (TPR) repeat protein
MNKSQFLRRRWILTAAVTAATAGSLLAPSTASAQYRINNNGRALDANNQVGSGGRNPNDAAARQPNLPTGNDIVTGNVTAGRHFRGDVDYTDPGAFRGRTAGIRSDNFLRQSSGPGQDTRLAEEATKYYGDSRGVAPPANFTQAGIGSSGYIPAQPTVNRSIGDQRGGAIDFNQPFVLPAAGQLLLPGPIDPSAGQQYITASPLTGIRQLNMKDLNAVVNTQYNPATGKFDQNAIQRMQDELNAAAANSNPGAAKLVDPLNQTLNTAGSTDAANAGTAAPAGTTPPLPGGAPMEQKSVALDGPGAVAIEQKPLAGPLNNSLNTQQSTRQRLLVKPEAQSSLYAELLKKHEETAGDQNISDTQAAQAYNAARRAQGQAAAAAPGAPGAPGSPATPDQAAQPGAPGAVPGTTPPPTGAATPGGTAPGVVDYAQRGEQILKGGAPGAQKPGQKKKIYAPVKVPSLATGVKAKGLSDVLKNAENLMKDGKFTSALDQYDQAEQVAPNNPLIRLGRANAELGASYYARAEAHLRDVFGKNPELLSGQYDLTGMLGEQRVAVLVKDLKEIANREQREPRPVFLLAYIAYNTGHEQNAEAYLDLADKRSGGKDAFFQLLRDNWALPQAAAPTTAPAPANK